MNTGGALMGDILVSGEPASGQPLILSAPISFWGGVNPATGDIIDARHPQRGQNIAGKVLGLPGTIGSSSASSVLLELVRNGRAPAAILMPEADAILLLGLIVAKEMGWPTPMALQLDRDSQSGLAGAARISVAANGGVAAD